MHLFPMLVIALTALGVHCQASVTMLFMLPSCVKMLFAQHRLAQPEYLP
jgi:hypothetical protein